MKKKIISFSVWGNDPKYSVGALKNADLQEEIYPEWTCRFYVEKDHPVIKDLKNFNCEIIEKDLENCWGLFWRFEAAFDSTIERCIVRDCDSRINIREADAVKEWENSGYKVHSMKDHFYHRNYHFLAGMWGIVSGSVPDFENLMLNYKMNTKRALNRDFSVREELDQFFLNRIMGPLVLNDCLIHDDLGGFSDKKIPFKKSLPNGFFVGQQLYADDTPLPIP